MKVCFCVADYESEVKNAKKIVLLWPTRFVINDRKKPPKQAFSEIKNLNKNRAGGCTFRIYAQNPVLKMISCWLLTRTMMSLLHVDCCVRLLCLRLATFRRLKLFGKVKVWVSAKWIIPKKFAEKFRIPNNFRLLIRNKFINSDVNNKTKLQIWKSIFEAIRTIRTGLALDSAGRWTFDIRSMLQAIEPFTNHWFYSTNLLQWRAWNK